MDYNGIKNQINSGEFAPIYVFHGEESFFIDKLTALIESKFKEQDPSGFNSITLYGKDTNVDKVLTAVRSYSMLGTLQLVVLKEAQQLKNIDDLSSYLSNHLDQTVFVINYKGKTIDAKSKLLPYIRKDKSIVSFISKKVYDNQVSGWIVSTVKQEGFMIEQRAALLLAENIGNNLQRVYNEIEKLLLLLDEGSTITMDFVEEKIGISKEYNSFELQDALAVKDVLKANRIITYMGKNMNSNPITSIVVVLFNFYKRLLVFHYSKDKNNKDIIAAKLGVHPYFVEVYRKASRCYDIRKTVEILGTLREYDLKSKGVDVGSTAHEELLRELIFKIIH